MLPDGMGLKWYSTKFSAFDSILSALQHTCARRVAEEWKLNDSAPAVLVLFISMGAYIQEQHVYQTKHDTGIPHFQMKMRPLNRRQLLLQCAYMLLLHAKTTFLQFLLFTGLY
jgi:hypothetical protein